MSCTLSKLRPTPMSAVHGYDLSTAVSSRSIAAMNSGCLRKRSPSGMRYPT